MNIPVIMGPTASGKTGLALECARELGMDIISCDSRQVYRYMNIGTAKPTPAQQQNVHHWLIDCIEPDTSFSAHEFATRAHSILLDLAAAGRRAMFVGGTGFYFRALAEGIGPRVGADPAFRAEMEKKVRDEGAESIFYELKRLDPVTAQRSHPGNVQRNIRALEVFHLTGMPLSDARKTAANRPGEFTFSRLVLVLPRDILYNRINRRVQLMIDNGLWNEFRSLRARGYDESSPGMRCIGYQELFAVERGQQTLHEAVAEIRKHTRRYAKRQITWFRHQYGGNEFDPSPAGSAGTLRVEIERLLQGNA